MLAMPQCAAGCSMGHVGVCPPTCPHHAPLQSPSWGAIQGLGWPGDLWALLAEIPVGLSAAKSVVL